MAQGGYSSEGLSNWQVCALEYDDIRKTWGSIYTLETNTANDAPGLHHGTRYWDSISFTTPEVDHDSDRNPELLAHLLIIHLGSYGHPTGRCTTGK